MKGTRFYAWAKTLFTIACLLFGITLYQKLFPDNNIEFQDTLNLLFGIVIFHLLTDKYENEYKEK